MATTITAPTGPIDCACVIHGTVYSWTYVERLYNMLNRNISVGVRLHVYTEADRPVPAPMIKHELEPWIIRRARRGWWYKMQLFNCEHHAGPLLYFDLDTVIVGNIDWIWQQPLQYFWAVRDFKYLWRSTHTGINSSIMWWGTNNTRQIWQSFLNTGLDAAVGKYHGDQDFISAHVAQQQQRFLDHERILSWRWQCLDGGYDFKRRKYRNPGAGTNFFHNTSVLVCHGDPKPLQIQDLALIQHWR